MPRAKVSTCSGSSTVSRCPWPASCVARHTAAIAAVYTPPDLRRRGYAGSVTAAVAELAFAQGKRTACLYTDLRNPFSNRCYAKIGFEPVCDSLHYPRAETTRLSAQ